MLKILKKKPEIVIWVKAYWEKSDDKKYCKSGYRGGWDISKCPGHPEINGGHCSPDFTETPASIKEMFVNRYNDYFDNVYEIIVKLTIVKDERNPTMESFF